MLRAAAPLAAEVSGLKITVAQSGEELRPLIEDILARSEVAATLEVGDLHATLSRARSALAASGTVLTDLLHHRLPTVVIYAVRGGLRSRLVPALLTTPHFSTTNLLAGGELLPERGFQAHAPGPLEEVGALLRRAHLDEEWRATCRSGLERAVERIGPAGAARRCAQHVLEVALGSTQPL
jgi:lipid A disaccharide synthetase